MGKDPVSKRVSFFELCGMLDQMKGAVSSSKRQYFNEFLKHWRQESITKNADGSMEFLTTDTFYPAMRIFVPGLDQDSRQFGMGNVRRGRSFSFGSQQLATSNGGHPYSTS